MLDELLYLSKLQHVQCEFAPWLSSKYHQRRNHILSYSASAQGQAPCQVQKVVLIISNRSRGSVKSSSLQLRTPNLSTARKFSDHICRDFAQNGSKEADLKPRNLYTMLGGEGDDGEGTVDPSFYSSNEKWKGMPTVPPVPLQLPPKNIRCLPPLQP